MDQYHPMWKVLEDGNPLYQKLRRRISGKEYREAVEAARNAGLHRGIPFDSWG
jgi:uncharacterized Fe-S radical SAM superfamily protein PflX